MSVGNSVSSAVHVENVARKPCTTTSSRIDDNKSGIAILPICRPAQPPPKTKLLSRSCGRSPTRLHARSGYVPQRLVEIEFRPQRPGHLASSRGIENEKFKSACGYSIALSQFLHEQWQF